MYNCVIVRINGRPHGIFHSIDHAEMFRQLYLQQFGHLNPVIYCDWSYIPDLPF